MVHVEAAPVPVARASMWVMPSYFSKELVSISFP